MKFIGNTESGSVLSKLLFGILGAALVLMVWILLTSGATPILGPTTLPSPGRVLTAFGELYHKNELVPNVGFSIGLNLAGYVEALAIALPIGFIIGLIKYTRWGFQRQVDAIRYIPLTALLPLFIGWFGIDADMKIHFLAFGILIYLLPVMVQRIDEVDDVFLKTVHTLGATDWQVLRTVYFPSVLSRLSDDIRVLTAISWTYIIVAEMIASQGGIGNLIYAVGFRQGRYDKVFALLIIIMLIGIIQDKIFVWLDRQLFPHKYQAKDSIKSSRIEQKGVVSVILDYSMMALGWIVIIFYIVLMINEFIPFLNIKPLSYLFGEPVWVIHLIVMLFLFYRGWKWFQERSDAMALQSVKAQSS